MFIMKKRLLLARAVFTLLAMLCFSVGVRAQSELTIYEDATGNSSYVPVYGLWADAYLKCEFVVPADELAAMNGGTISQMTFYLKQSAEVAWTGTFQVFLKEVEDATISAFSGTDDATIVYEGTLDATGSTMSIEFSNFYTYGGGNLLVGVYQTTPGNYKSATFYGETVTGACVSGYNSNSLDMSATQRNFIPKTTFTYSGGGAMVFSKPKNLVVDLSDDTAVLSWTAPNNDVTGYAYQYKKAGDENWSQEETVNETTVTLSGLSLATPYEFQVKALYDGGESGYVTISFFTDCGAYSLPFTYGFEDADELKCWTLDYTANTPGIVADPTHTGSKSFRFSSYSTASSYDQYLISPKLDTTKGVDVEFYYRSYGSGNGEKFKVGYSTTTNDPSEFTWGDEITTTTTEWTLFEESFPAGTNYVAIYYCTNYQYYLYIDDFSISEASDYPKPTGLTVNYTGDDVAEVSWTSDATSFDIDVNGTITEGVTSPYTLNDLALGTTYEVKVRANYGNGNYSEWTAPVSFTTNECMDEDMCYITYEIKAKPYQGSYQYGWYNSYLLVYNNVNGDDSDEMIDAWTVPQNDEDGIVTGALQVCPGQNIRFEWYSQSSYDNLFIGDIIVKDANGEDIINTTGALADAVSYVVDCTISEFKKPTDLAVSEIGPHGAVLSWTENGEATAWVVEVTNNADNVTATFDAPEIPYTLTGLVPNTEYFVRVRPAGENDKWSDGITFSTFLSSPTAITASNITETSAVISWTGNDDAESYNLRYKETTPPATIILEAGDIWDDGSGYQMLLDADATAYGTVFTSTGGWTATDYNDFEYLIPTNADCSADATNFVLNNSVSIQIPAGTYDWCILNPSPDYGKIYIAASNGNVGGRADDYVFEAGKTYTFVPAIFGSNDGIDVTITGEVASPVTSEWTTVENVTSPYTIEGLEEDTYYEAEVQSVYADGESGW